MDLKTRKLQIRLTKEELSYIKEHSANYCSMSHYILRAVKEYSDPSEIQRLRLIEALGRFYRENTPILSQVSRDFNQTMKRTNELALSGHLTQTNFSSTLVPELIRTRLFLESFIRQLPSLTKIILTYCHIFNPFLLFMLSIRIP